MQHADKLWQGVMQFPAEASCHSVYFPQSRSGCTRYLRLSKSLADLVLVSYLEWTSIEYIMPWTVQHSLDPSYRHFLWSSKQQNLSNRIRDRFLKARNNCGTSSRDVDSEWMLARLFQMRLRGRNLLAVA